MSYYTYVTIFNYSSSDLFYTHQTGNWEKTPGGICYPTDQFTYTLEPDGYLEGSTGSLTYNQTVLSFGCPVTANSNYASTSGQTGATTFAYTFAKSNKSWGKDDWGNNNPFPGFLNSNWGHIYRQNNSLLGVGSFPINGSPLSVLFVVVDSSYQPNPGYAVPPGYSPYWVDDSGYPWEGDNSKEKLEQT